MDVVRPVFQLLFVSVLLVLSGAGVSAANIAACGNVAGGDVYTLTANLYVGDQTCLNVTGSDVDINCQGFWIAGNLTDGSGGNAAGILVQTKNNVTVANCRILNFSRGVRVSGSSNVTIRNNTIWNNTNQSIAFNNGPNNQSYVYNNTLSYSGSHGVSMSQNTFNVEIYNNLFYNNSGNAVSLQSGYNNNITNNTIWNGSNNGVRADTYENNSYIFNNTIYNQSQNGVGLAQYVRGAHVTFNLIYNNSQYGVLLQGGAYNNVSNNTISNHSTQYAIIADSGENFSRFESNVIYNNNRGIAIGGAGTTNNTVRNNTVTYTGSGGPVFYVYNYVYNTTVANNTVTNHSGVGVSLSGNVYFSYLFSNSFTNGANNGVSMASSASNNTLFLNNFSIVYGRGMSLSESSYNNLSYNRIENVSDNGFNLEAWSLGNIVADNVVVNNTLTGVSSFYGLRLTNSSPYNSVLRNSFNYTGAGGVILTNNITNTTVTSNNIWFTPGVGVFVESSSQNNTLFGNTIVNTSTAGIKADTFSAYNYLANNTIFNSSAGNSIGYGVHLTGSASNNFVDYNNVSYSYGNLLLVENSSNNTMRFNNFSVTTIQSVFVNTYSAYNVFHNNTVTGAITRALELSNASFNNFTNNTFRTFESIWFYNNATNNTLSYNTLLPYGPYGIQVSSVSYNNTFSYNTVANASSLLWLYNHADENFFIGNSWSNGSNNGFLVNFSSRNFFSGGRVWDAALTQPNAEVLLDNGSTLNQFVNFTVSGSATKRQFSLNTSSSATLVNATFNKSLVDVFGAASNLTVRWFLRVQATDYDGNAASGVVVSIANTTNLNESAVSLSDTSAANGYIGQVTVTEFFNTSAAANNVSNYNISAVRSYGSSVGSNQTFYNVTGTGSYVIQVNVPPIVTLYSPANNSFNASTNVSFQFEVSDLESASYTNCWLWTNQTAWGAKQANVSTIVNGSNNTLYYNFSSDGVYAWNVQCFDKANVSAFASTNYSITVDNSTPAGFGYASPTLANNSNTSNSWVYVNVSFTESNPASCLLDFNNGTAVNYSMTVAGSGSSRYCYHNLTLSNQGHFNYTVYVYDAANNANNSERRYVTVDTAVPSAFSYTSPTLANNSNSSNASVYVNVSFTEANPSSCLLDFNNGTAVNYSMTVVGSNGASPYCYHNLSLSNQGGFNYTVYVNDSAGNLNNSPRRYVAVDSTLPAAFSFVSPTLANGTLSIRNYTEVNFTFTELNPDSCLLEFSNGTKVNYTMARTGNNCWYNLTINENGAFNYTVFANDTFGNWNNSGTRFVTLSDDSTAPTVSLHTPAHATTLTSTPSFVFSFTDAVSSTAYCLLFVDGVNVGANAALANFTNASISSNGSVSAAPHSWYARCTDNAGNAGTSPTSEFSLSPGGSTPSSTPVPTAVPVPTATPVPSATPVPAAATAEPSPEPSAGPSPTPAGIEAVGAPEPTPAPEMVTEEEVVVVVEEPEAAEQPVAGETPAGDGPVAAGEPVTVVVRQSLAPVDVAPASTVGWSGSGSAYAILVNNIGDGVINNLKVTQRLAFIEYRGPSPDDYPEIEWVPRPIRIERGSAVVTWMFDNVQPGQEVKAEVKVPQKLEKEDVRSLGAPRVVARSVSAAQVSVGAAASVRPVGGEPVPGGFDYTLPAVALVLLLGAGAAFYFTRKPRGL